MKAKKVTKAPFKPASKSSKGGVWVFFIWIFTFLISAALTLAMSNIIQSTSLTVATIILLCIILINILSDIIGTAITAADEIPFNSMAARKVYGAKTAIMLLKNADKVSNLCNDVIGDICGIVSGAAAAYILVNLVGGANLYAEALLGGFVAALTVGGKSLGKSTAISNSNAIVYKVAVVIRFIKGKEAK